MSLFPSLRNDCITPLAPDMFLHKIEPTGAWSKDVKVAHEQLRRADSRLTTDFYKQVVSEEKRSEPSGSPPST